MPIQADFYPPRESPLFIRMVGRALPLIGRLWRGVEQITIAEEDLARLAALRDRRFLLCANHPTLGDPLVIFELGRRAGITFNYLAARDLFRWPWRWMLQRLGAYSVLRGAPDREAMRATRRVLAQEDRRIVVFPEGVTYEHNDLLLPFHTGVTQIGFWALDDLEKLGKDVRLPVFPVAIKYLFRGDARAAIQASLQGLERALGITPPAGADLYGRLRAAGERVLADLERELGLTPSAESALAARIASARRHVLERVARALDVKLPAEAPTTELLHALDNALTASIREFAGSSLAYEQRLHERRLEDARPLARDLGRLHNFLAVTDGYVAARMTAERFLEVLGHLEVEVLGRRRRRGRYHAVVRIGVALELADYYGEYRQNKRAAVAAATEALERRIQALLEPLSALGTPLGEPAAGEREPLRK